MIFHTSLESLGLVSLESIENGQVVVMRNSKLCYLGNIPWHEILHSSNQTKRVGENRPSDDCGGWTAFFLFYTFRPRNESPSATNVVVLLLLGVVVSTNAFSFHNRLSSNFACRLVTALYTIAPSRIFKLSLSWSIIINFLITKIAVQCTVKQKLQQQRHLRSRLPGSACTGRVRIN